MRILLLAFVLLTASAWAQGPGNPVKPLERSPHIFYEPQAKYPPQGADEAVGGALPLALGAALLVFGGVFWLTRPLPALEVALEHARARAHAAPPPGVRDEPAAPEEPVVPEVEPVAPEVEPVAPEEPRRPVVALEEPLPAPPPPRRERPRPLAGPPVGVRIEPPAESPLRRFSWKEAAGTLPLPLVPGGFTGPGLVGYLAPAEVRPRLLAATAAALLEGTKGRVILVATGVTPEEVVAELLGAEGATLEALRRHSRRLERLARRLYVPRGGTLPVERLLRAAEGASAVVLDSASRLEMGAPEASQWLRDLHAVGSHGGFPVFLVAESLPPSAPLQRSFRFETWPPAPRELSRR